MTLESFGQLVPLGGGDPIPLLGSKLLIGRRESCDITLEFPNVSSRHCELEFVGGYWRLRDLGSSNGTKVNGERVSEVFLQPGDQLGVAKNVYTIDYTPDPNAPLPVIEEDPFAQSLLEKAGLARPEDRRSRPKPKRPSATGILPPATRPVPPPKPAKPNDDDDLAMKFLQE
jgi:adenylate cyclase